MHLVDPLLAALKELGRQKKELVSIIKRKDREIEDYRESGASVSRREYSGTICYQMASRHHCLRSPAHHSI